MRRKHTPADAFIYSCQISSSICHSETNQLPVSLFWCQRRENKRMKSPSFHNPDLDEVQSWLIMFNKKLQKYHYDVVSAMINANCQPDRIQSHPEGRPLSMTGGFIQFGFIQVARFTQRLGSIIQWIGVSQSVEKRK